MIRICNFSILPRLRRLKTRVELRLSPSFPPFATSVAIKHLFLDHFRAYHQQKSYFISLLPLNLTPPPLFPIVNVIFIN